MNKEIRTKINQTAHLLAQREFARIRGELMVLYAMWRKEGRAPEEILQAIGKLM